MLKSSLCYLVDRTNLLLLLLGLVRELLYFFSNIIFPSGMEHNLTGGRIQSVCQPVLLCKKKRKATACLFLHVTSSQSKAAKTNERKTKIWSVKQINRLLIFTPPSHPISAFTSSNSTIPTSTFMSTFMNRLSGGTSWEMQCPKCEFEFENKINCA